MYVNMVIRPVYTKKEVSTGPNKIKHNSPYKGTQFSP